MRENLREIKRTSVKIEALQPTSHWHTRRTLPTVGHGRGVPACQWGEAACDLLGRGYWVMLHHHPAWWAGRAGQIRGEVWPPAGLCELYPDHPHSHTSSVALPEVFKVHSLKMDQIAESTEDTYYAMSEARPGDFNLGEAFAFSPNLAYFNTVRLLCWVRVLPGERVEQQHLQATTGRVPGLIRHRNLRSWLRWPVVLFFPHLPVKLLHLLTWRDQPETQTGYLLRRLGREDLEAKWNVNCENMKTRTDLYKAATSVQYSVVIENFTTPGVKLI